MQAHMNSVSTLARIGMSQKTGTIISIVVALLLVLAALLFDLRTAALIAGIYLIVFAMYRLIWRKKRET